MIIASTLSACFVSQGRTQNTVSVNYSQVETPLVRLNQAVSTTQISKGPHDDQIVKNLGMRLERTFWSPAVWAQAGTGQYNFIASNPFPGVAPAPDRDWGSDSPLLDNIITQGAQPVICFTGEPGWDASSDTQSAQLNGLPIDMGEYQQLVKDGLNHLRQKYPGIQYIEVWNEPDNSLTSTQYDTLYQNVSQAVQAVNAELPSGQRRFLVGGPSVYNPGSMIMANFISFVKAQNLELDFLSWHEYGGNVRSDAQTLQNKLSSVGLNPNLPQFVTEWGYTSYNSTSIPTANQLMVAATYIAQGWTELETDNLARIVTTFPFSEDEYSGYSRSMLVPYGENPADGQVFPLYNVFRMMAMEKNMRVASSGGTSSLFPLATEDGTGVALMLTNTAGSKVNVNLNNLPSAFQQGTFQLTEYLVDKMHSNWAYDQSTSMLQEIANSTEGAAISFSTTLTMAQDSVILLVLRPTKSSGGGSNLIQDPGFEFSSALAPYWSVDGGPTASGVDLITAHAHSGSHAGYIYDGSGAQKFVDLFQSVTVMANTNYTLTGEIDASHTTGSAFGVRTTSGTNIAATAFTNTDPGPATHRADYHQYTVTFNSGRNTSVVVFAGYKTPGSGSFINVDDVSLLSR
jgi:Glycosyl hydrolase catalytic core